ncbi:cation/cationic drug transporter [Terriglobus roseus DSM 18391]|uniref:Cation/cationic drug transporter n=1 Tax=Terriglobus roseus (strain DSM 18391 / NRRL B-41598 / KBS 63) TaxID=926566 RepID=I3ZDC2_TERRK|nr:SMR family transporter [Terriglobus roseus]AFL87240.1 cation/cationic drug transporter [Terriglobus roseus DSM 18391]
MTPRSASLLALTTAILAETSATTALKASHGFTRLWPSVTVVLGYAIAFYCMTIALRTLPIGVVYAVWSGVGIVLISLLGWLVYRERLDAAALAGIALICAGVLVNQIFSHSAAH